MRVTIELPGFQYSKDPNFIKMLEPVFQGEYDVPINIKCPRILDIGANIGAFSIWAIHRWPGAIVYAYEPLPSLYTALEENIDRTNSAGVIPIDFGVGIYGARKYYVGKNNPGEGGFYTDGEDSIDLVVRSPLVLPNANIIKIDTEGCEVEILAALIEDGRRFDAIMFEYHRKNDRHILETLLQKNYTLTGAQIYNYNRGVMKYVNSDLIGGN